MVCDSHKSADLGVILQRHNIKFQREKKIASLNAPKKTFLSSLFKLCQIICSWAFYQRSAAVSLFSAFWLCVLLHRNVFSWLMMSSLPLLHPSTHSQWGSCQNDSDVESEVIIRGYVCVTASCFCSFASLSLSAFLCVKDHDSRKRCWLCDTDGPDAPLTLGFTNGPGLLWASNLSSWIYLSNRTPVRGLYRCITPWPEGRRWWWASGGMLGSLASGRLAHDQSALGVTVEGERKVLKVEGKQLAQYSWLWSMWGCEDSWRKRTTACWSRAWWFCGDFSVLEHEASSLPVT